MDILKQTKITEEAHAVLPKLAEMYTKERGVPVNMTIAGSLAILETYDRRTQPAEPGKEGKE